MEGKANMYRVVLIMFTILVSFLICVPTSEAGEVKWKQIQTSDYTGKQIDVYYRFHASDGNLYQVTKLSIHYIIKNSKTGEVIVDTERTINLDPAPTVSWPSPSAMFSGGGNKETYGFTIGVNHDNEVSNETISFQTTGIEYIQVTNW